MDRKELLELIRQAARDKRTILDLSGKGITELPPEIGQLTQLTRLVLWSNKLTSLPPEIGRLTRLTELDLSGNKLTSLPPEIGQLTHLTALILWQNKLTSLPPEIGQLTQLTALHLGENKLTSLPPEIGQLTQLTELDLTVNPLTWLPPEIGQLTQLTHLNLGGNKLTSLPPEIGQLTQLTELSLWGNQLTSLPPEIGQLTQLTDLYLGGNKLTSLPPEIGQLTQLTQLTLWSNPLTSLPPEIGQLIQLTQLDLDKTKLTAAPPEIGQLTQLAELDLARNELTSLPPEIGRLTRLTDLVLTGNKLTWLPPEIGQLTQLTELYLHDNPNLGIPPEVLGPTWMDVQDSNKKPASPQAILDYYFRTRQAKASERRAMNEVKVILVGQGSVGKTSLVKRIAHGKFNKREKKTDGIYIEKSWSVAGRKKDEPVRVNFWDFGGQEIMHATHQFFLTKRTVYLLVIDARKGENESNLHYWLKIIRSFGGNSPVLVVTNKCDAHHLDLNETRLKKDYPAIRGFFKTSCETNAGIEELKEGIRKQIHGGGMRHVFDPLPKEYFTIKKKIEDLAQARNYIGIREYYQLCGENGVPDTEEQDRLLRFLHDLGSVLSFTDPESPLPVREMSVLNPHWVTKGVYKILNDKTLPEAGGELRKDDVARILNDRGFPVTCHDFIVAMMHKFELCFTIRDGHRWLVAELLPVKEPETLGDWSDALRFQYRYEVLPGGILCRFIVRRYGNLGRRPIYWRSGVVLEFDRCKALVRGDTDNAIMHIAVTGPEGGRRAFLSVLRDEFQRIHATIPNLQPEEMVPLPDDPEVVVPYDHLLTLEQQGVIDFIPQGTKKRYGVAELLDGIEDPWLRDFGESHLHPPLFVVEPQTSFPDAWEVFCCDVINRHEKTTEIRRRKPPETGVDLYWPSKKTAYQCKSVEESTGKFSVTKAVESLKSALTIKDTLPWTKYVLCSNVALTGPQEKQLRDILPDIAFLTPSYWLPRCREQSNHLGGRFRQMSPMNRRRGRGDL